MECLVVFLILVAAIVAITFSLSSSSGSVNAAYRKLGKHFHGRVRTGGWFSYTRLVFKYGATEARLQTRRRNGRVVTELVIDWPLADYWCRIISAKRNVKVPRRLHEVTAATQLCSPYFRVFSDDAQSAQLMLTDGVQWQLRNLARNSFGRDLLVELAVDRILFQIDGYVWRYDTVMSFMESALEFYDQIMLTRCEGIDFVDGEEMTTLSDGKCSVCGEQAIGDLVFCKRCKTPHHRECWHYNGMCTIYGCGETNFVVPSIASRIDAPHEQLVPQNDLPETAPAQVPTPGRELSRAVTDESEHGEDNGTRSGLSDQSGDDSEIAERADSERADSERAGADDSETDEGSIDGPSDSVGDSAVGDVAM